MKRKKKNKKEKNDHKLVFFNLNETVIKNEDKINHQLTNIEKIENELQIHSNIINYDFSSYIDENFKYLYKNITPDYKIFYNSLNKYYVSYNNEKYYFIKFFNNYNKVIYQLNNKINIYKNIFNDSIDYNIKYEYFIGLIKDDNCIPFWNDEIKEISKNIFLPIKENLKEVKQPKTFNYKNWFSTKHYINKNPNDKLYKIENNVERKFNNTYLDIKTGKIKNIIKCKKVKMYLDSEQKKYLCRLFGVYRYYYNRALQYINNYNKETKKTFFYVDYSDKKTIKHIDLKEEKNIFTYITMRNYLKEDEPKWMNEICVFSHLIDKAFSEVCSNYKSSMTKYKKYGIPFYLKVKNKKSKYQTMNLELSMFNKETNTLFKKIKKSTDTKKSLFENLKLSENIKNLNLCDFSISCNIKLNKYFLNMNYRDEVKKDVSILKNKKVCSIDPGLKTYLTIYSDNKVEELGIGITKKLNKICKETDILNSRINKKKTNKKEYNLCSNKRRNLKKALHRKIEYLENLKNELHNKCINHLIKNYGKIILPKLETQEMVGKFNSKLSRSLYNLSNNKFLSKLEKKCKENDIILIKRPEYYTSKTCSRCGWLNNELKISDREYKCKKCELCIDRDINASRNIMLRNNEWELPPCHRLEKVLSDL
jgi:IS605 OrfB family transposase